MMLTMTLTTSSTTTMMWIISVITHRGTCAEDVITTSLQQFRACRPNKDCLNCLRVCVLMGWAEQTGVCARVCRRWRGMRGRIGHMWGRVVVVMWAVTSPPPLITTGNLQKNPLKWRTSANVWKKNLLLEYWTISPFTALWFALYLIQIKVKSKLFLLRNQDRVYMFDLCGQNKKFIYFSVLTVPFLSVLWGALFCFGFWILERKQT